MTTAFDCIGPTVDQTLFKEHPTFNSGVYQALSSSGRHN
jgi:hypothetical protein